MHPLRLVVYPLGEVVLKVSELVCGVVLLLDLIEQGHVRVLLFRPVVRDQMRPESLCVVRFIEKLRLGRVVLQNLVQLMRLLRLKTCCH